jgi:cytochrome oxidase Cu insertion factor (SCO1/SenC/PrrC family)
MSSKHSRESGGNAAKAGSESPGQQAAASRGSWKRGRWVVLAIGLLCAAPIIASYLTYYVIKPKGGATNYGTLIEPQRPISAALIVKDETGKTMPLASLRGRWLMVSVDRSACDQACATKLYFMRQIRATQGGERERMLTVWLRTDADAVPAVIEQAYPDTLKLIADSSALSAWLPAEAGTSDIDHIYLVDPNGNLMMRFPKNADPNKIKGDVTKLLKWSSIG